MLTKRVVVCLDVRDGQVVKGTQFKNHKNMGDVLELAKRYEEQGADELVLYDIAASARGDQVDPGWVKDIAKMLSIPFCVAGGIKSVPYAAKILENGADKISINSPALHNPDLINEMAQEFGSQCIVLGIDSLYSADSNEYEIFQFTGIEEKTLKTQKTLFDWAREGAERGAGEIVLNYMGKDGTKSGFETKVTGKVADLVSIPVIASGGAGLPEHFTQLFTQTKVSAGLGAGMFHRGEYTVNDVKKNMIANNLPTRIEND